MQKVFSIWMRPKTSLKNGFKIIFVLARLKADTYKACFEFEKASSLDKIALRSLLINLKIKIYAKL